MKTQSQDMLKRLNCQIIHAVFLKNIKNSFFLNSSKSVYYGLSNLGRSQREGSKTWLNLIGFI